MTENEEIEIFGRKLVSMINDQIASHQLADGLQISISGTLYGLAQILVAVSPSLDHALSGAECFHNDMIEQIKDLWSQQQSLEKH